MATVMQFVVCSVTLLKNLSADDSRHSLDYVIGPLTCTDCILSLGLLTFFIISRSC